MPAGATGRWESSCHNAGALTGKDVRGYFAGTNGAAGIMHIPPLTPQPSPTETEWREARAAMAGILFGGPDRMRDATMSLPCNREMPIVRLSGWLLPPQYTPRHPIPCVARLGGRADGWSGGEIWLRHGGVKDGQ